MRKYIRLFILLIILLFTVSVKAKNYTEDEYKGLNIRRAYILCDYVFNMDDGFNPTLKDFLLASQTCPIDNVTLYEIKYTEDINGNPTKSYTELLNNRKTTIFPSINIKQLYKSSIGNNPDKIVDETPTNIVNNLDTTPYNETKFEALNVRRSYVIGAYVFKVDSDFNPTLKDILLANQSNPKGEVSIYQINFAQDINGNATKTYTELLTGKKLDSFPELNLRYYFWGDIIPNNHSSESKRDLMNADSITYSLGSYTYNGESPNIRTATSKSGLPITYKVYGNEICSGNEIEEYKNAGTYSVLASTEGNSEYAKASKCVKFTINKKNGANFTITLNQDIFGYDGNEKRPEVTVKDGDNVLVLNTDYSVGYENNIELSTSTPAKVIVTFMGNYSGSKTKEFTISSKVIGISITNLNYTYDGTPKSFNLEVTEPSSNLVTVLYGESEDDITQTEKPTYTDAGRYVIYYSASTADNSYTKIEGSFVLTIIRAKDSITCEEKTGLVYNGVGQSINDPVASSPISSVNYYLASNCPTVNGKYNCSGATSPNPPTDAGNYIAVIMSSGNNNYEGTTKYVRHNIAQKNGNLTTLSFENDVNTYTYNNGEAITPTVKVYDNERGVYLVKGTDYDVTYSNNTQVSTSTSKAIATVTFKGNYNGSKTIEFTITPDSMQNVVTVDSITTKYTGNYYSITVNAPNGSTIEYSEGNNNSYSSENPRYKNVGNYTIWVKVTKEGFAPVELSTTIVINPATDILSIEPVIATYNGNPIEANKASLQTLSGTPVSYEYYKYEDCEGTISNLECDQSKVLTGAPKDAGSYYVKVISNVNNQNTNYTSEVIYQTHIIDAKPSSGLQKSLSQVDYNYSPTNTTGYRPSVIIVDQDLSYTLVEGKDYTIDSYTNNINASIAATDDNKPKVSFTFIGNYSGSGWIKFIIHPIDIGETVTTVGDENGTRIRVYVDKTIPDITVKFGDTINSINNVATRHELETTAYYESDAKTTCGANYIYYRIEGNSNYNPHTSNGNAEVSCQTFIIESGIQTSGSNYLPVITAKTSTGDPINTADRTVMFGTRNDSSNANLECSTNLADYTVEEANLTPFTTTSWAICFVVTKPGYTTSFGQVRTQN